MKYMQGMVPAWISSHTYLFGQADSRTYISNEKTHTYVLLEGLASDLWKLLCDDVPQEELAAWVQENGLSDQIDGFLDELAEQGLLSDGTKCEKAAGFDPLSKEASGEEEAQFVARMQDWIWAHHGLFSLFFELTYRCDLKCVHCYNPKDMSSVELDVDMCKRAIDDAYEMGCFRITFSGGESALHSHFLELVAYARRKRISVEIFTNGQRLSDDADLLHDLLALYPYRICVSLYSTQRQMHERVTAVEGSFDKTYSLIRQLRAQNVNVQIKNFLLNFNCFDCIKVKQMAKEIGATSLADISLIPTIEGDKKTLQFMLTEEELFRLYTDPDSPLYVGDGFSPIDRTSRMHDAPCSGGFSGLCVGPTGKLTICVSMPLSVGDLKTQSLYEIWSAAMRGDPECALYKWQKLSLVDYTQCFKEDYCAFCHFCPGMGFLENGYLKKSDVLCRQANVRMKSYRYLQGKGSVKIK